MRNMSFMLTQRQFRNKTKTVTRRLGWRYIKPGDLITGCEKCQGLKKGEKIVKLGVIRILSNRRVPLSPITPADVAKEGFPGMTPVEFVKFFCEHNKCSPLIKVNRIEFEYIG